MYTTQLKNRKKDLEAKLAITGKHLSTLPTEGFFCVRQQNHFKWFQSKNGKSIYIPKQNYPLAKKLALKKYYSYQYAEFSSELHAIDSYLHIIQANKHYSDQLLNDPGYHELLSDTIYPLSKELWDWWNAKYESNPNHPENKIHKSPSGHVLRSKSEQLIDLCLLQKNIPFRYEAPLDLGVIAIYPDFTIRHPVTGELFYWEHFGMIDRPDYVQRFLTKLQLYINNGIYPSINLICTFETKSNPLTIQKIQETINQYFFRT